MAEIDLKKLNRKELIEIIYKMKKKEIKLQKRLDEVELELSDKTVKINNAGSIAEAALSLSDVFASAQEAANIYVINAQKNFEESEKMKKQAEDYCKKIINSAEIKAKNIEENTKI